MSDKGVRRHILCYDIGDPKRLSRVHRRVKRDAMALQYSVFDCHLNEMALKRLINDLRKLIDERDDDIRLYGPRLDAPLLWLGVTPFQGGVTLFNKQ